MTRGRKEETADSDRVGCFYLEKVNLSKNKKF